MNEMEKYRWNREQTQAKRTRHEELFSHTYWGWMPQEGMDKDVSERVIENRNALGDEVRGIAKFRWPHNMPYELDHPEKYRLKDGRLAIYCSNYNGPPPAIFGMEPTAPIYMDSVKSYVGVYESVKAFKAIFKRLPGWTR